MTAVIRPMSWTDIDALVDLEAALFADDAWNAPTWWAELAQRPRRDYVVAEAGGGVAGYAGVDLSGDVADVMTLAVVPGARGTGLGDRLLGHLEDRAMRAGAQALLLEVRADNEPARRLYDRHGFAVLATRRKYYQPGDIDAIVLRKLLRGKEIES